MRNQGKLNILVSAVFPCDGDPLGKGNGNGVGGWTIVDDQGLAPIECLGAEMLRIIGWVGGRRIVAGIGWEDSSAEN